MNFLFRNTVNVSFSLLCPSNLLHTFGTIHTWMVLELKYNLKTVEQLIKRAFTVRGGKIGKQYNYALGCMYQKFQAILSGSLSISLNLTKYMSVLHSFGKMLNYSGPSAVVRILSWVLQVTSKLCEDRAIHRECVMVPIRKYSVYCSTQREFL